MAISKKIDLNDSNSRRILELLRDMGIDISKEKAITIYIEDESLVIRNLEEWDKAKIIADPKAFDFWDNPEDSVYDDM